MSYTYCTNKTNEVASEVWEVDVILVRGKHDDRISSYSTAIDADNSFGANPKNVVIDSTSGDVVRCKTKDDSVEKIKDYCNGKTVIIASNDSRILPFFERISVIENERIILDGPKKEILYRLEQETKLIPNQIVRLITILKRSNVTIPHLTDLKDLNDYLSIRKRRVF